MKRALVVSAGGSKGSYAAGIIDYYYQIGRQYDIFVGSSTGSLVASLAASGDIEKLIQAYTSIQHKDIFKVNPFKIVKAKNGKFKYTINKFRSGYNIFWRKQNSLGDSSNLREKTIPKFFTKEDYNKIILNDKDLSVVVTNLTHERSEVKKISEWSYNEFCDWMWASTCAPPFMSMPVINNCDYIDGGIYSMVPIEHAILKGADEIDVILLDQEYPEIANIERVRNFFHALIKVMFAMIDKIKSHNVNLGVLSHMSKKDIRVNFHYTEKKLTNNSLIFNPEMMKKWCDMGYEYAKAGKCKSYILHGETNTYKLIE